MRNFILLALGIVVVLVSAPEVEAHALLLESSPVAGAVLQRSPQSVTTTFTEEPEPALSFIRVLDATGRQVERGPAQVVLGQPLTLQVDLGSLQTGAYTVTWRVVSRVDGHATAGTFAFGVGVSPPAATEAAAISPPPSTLHIAGRWGFYVGTFGLLGGAWMWAAIVQYLPRNAAGFFGFSLLISAVGLVGLGLSQAAEAGVEVSRLAGTALARALWWRAIPIVCAGVAIVAAKRLDVRARKGALIGVGVGAALAMLAHVSAGHAGAALGPWRLVKVGIQWAHVVGAGVWIGGLAALLVTLLDAAAPEERAAAARRFSTTAGIALGVVVVTGIARAVDEVGALNPLVTTRFGQLVTSKAGFLLTLAALGAVNRYRSVPAARRTLKWLRRVGAAELAVAGGVLVLTGMLTGFPPPSLIRQAAQASAPLVVSGNDFATSVRVRVAIKPGLPGPNRFEASVVDYDTGEPVAADRLTMRFSSSERPDVAPSTLELSRDPDGVYRAQGGNISLEGQWTVVLVVERGAGSVEVPLAVMTQIRPQRVQAIRAPGQPTLYIIELPGGRSLQVYLDPEKPGLNQLHATFFDAAGRELPIPDDVVITAALPGRAPATFPVRRFGPGHFVADAEVTPGDLQVDIAATGPDGEALRGKVTMQL